MTEYKALDELMDSVASNTILTVEDEESGCYRQDLAQFKTFTSAVDEREKTKAEIKRIEAEIAKLETENAVAKMKLDTESKSNKINVALRIIEVAGAVITPIVMGVMGYNLNKKVYGTMMDFESNGGMLTSNLSKKFVERNSVINTSIKK